MTKILSLSLAVFSLTFFGCQTATETKVENANSSNNQIQPAKTEIAPIKSEQKNAIDVPKLADKSIAELEKVFGKSDESKQIEKGIEYRLYKIAGQSKGLAVRFYDGKAKSFNLILDKPLTNSKEALKQIFGIDVGNSASVKDPKETLSEKYQGTFGGVKFTKVSAKKQENGKGFIFVFAEVAQ